MDASIAQIIYASQTPGTAVALGSAVDSWVLTSGQQISHNGTIDTITSQVITLYYHNHNIYQIAGPTSNYGAPGWWSWNAAWTDSPCLATESPNGYSITSPGQIIFASQTSGTAAVLGGTLDLWSIAPNGQVVHNGVNDTTTSAVIQLYYYNSTVYQEDTQLLWWYWNGTGWSPIAAPPTITSFITINPILNQAANTLFNVSGTISGYTTSPVLRWSLNGGAWGVLPGGSGSSTTGFTIVGATSAATAVGTIAVRDANNILIAGISNIFTVS